MYQLKQTSFLGHSHAKKSVVVLSIIPFFYAEFISAFS